MRARANPCRRRTLSPNLAQVVDMWTRISRGQTVSQLLKSLGLAGKRIRIQQRKQRNCVGQQWCTCERTRTMVKETRVCVGWAWMESRRSGTRKIRVQTMTVDRAQGKGLERREVQHGSGRLRKNRCWTRQRQCCCCRSVSLIDDSERHGDGLKHSN